MARRRYTPEQHAWMEAHWRSMANRELADAFEAEFGERITPGAADSYGGNRGWRKDPGVHAKALRRYTDEEREFLRGFIPGHSEREISAAFAERFGRGLEAYQIGNMKVELGVKSGTHGGRFEQGHVPWTKGRTWDEQGRSEEARAASLATCFKPGQLPHNTRPLLDERVGKDGYVEVHVGLHRMNRANDQWVSKAQLVWEQANGREWPEGCRCMFADGDRRNFDPGNIVPVPDGLYPIVCGAVPGGLEWHDRESLEAAITMAKVIRARRRLETR